MVGPPICPPWALFSCCSRRSSWKTRELFSVPKASSIVCFCISVSVSWWRRFSSSVWLLLIVLLVNWKREEIGKFRSISHMLWCILPQSTCWPTPERGLCICVHSIIIKRMTWILSFWISSSRSLILICREDLARCCSSSRYCSSYDLRKTQKRTA